VFPMYQQQQVRMQLSVNLVGVISQTLVKRKDGRGRAAAFEVLVATGAVRNLIREKKTYQIASLIQTGSKQKMYTLDQSLALLVEQGIVTYEDAMSRAKDAGELDRLMETRPEEAPFANGPSDQPGAPPVVGGVRGQPNRPGYKRE